MSGFAVFDIQRRAGRTLQAAATGGRLAHAYLFHGLEGTGKWAAAVETAKLIMCPDARTTPHHACNVCRRIADYHHPDVHWILPGSSREKSAATEAANQLGQTAAQIEEQENILAAKRADTWAALEFPRLPYITMLKVRALQSVLARTPAEGPRKVGIFINAEYLRADAQSVLLKTIEEPPRDSFIIITTSGRSMLLPTILSRCQAVLFTPLPLPLIHDRLISELGIEEHLAQRAAELSGGGWARAVRYAAEEWSVWHATAEALLKTTYTGSAEDVALAVDTVFKQRPDLSRVLFFFDVWYARLNAVLTGAKPGDQHPSADGDYSTAIHRCRATLDAARAAVIGNITPRVAVAAGLLEVRRQLPRRR